MKEVADCASASDREQMYLHVVACVIRRRDTHGASRYSGWWSAPTSALAIPYAVWRVVQGRNVKDVDRVE